MPGLITNTLRKSFNKYLNTSNVFVCLVKFQFLWVDSVWSVRRFCSDSQQFLYTHY